MYDLDNGFEGKTESGIRLYHATTTVEIAHDAAASVMKEVLETLPTVGQVECISVCYVPSIWC